MLPRKNRISKTMFPAVTRGVNKQNDLFRVVVSRDESLRGPKCAVIVSNKVAKTAVVRNKIRRQVYTELGKIIKRLPSSYVSIFPKKAVMTRDEVVGGLGDLFK